MRRLSPTVALQDGLELFRQSPAHNTYTVSDIYSYLQLPIKHHKIRLYYEANKPVGLVTWCWLSNTDAGLFLQDRYHPQEADYGFDLPMSKELWCIELIAPYGHAKQVVKSIRATTHELYGPQRVNWRRTHSRAKRRAKDI